MAKTTKYLRCHTGGKYVTAGKRYAVISETDRGFVIQDDDGHRHSFTYEKYRNWFTLGTEEPGAGITVLPDESLGGVLREYREVKREARAGESVIMTDATGTRTERGREVPDYHNGDVFVIDHVTGSLAVSTNGKLFYHREYSVLEPTDVLVIDGARYRMVDRTAAVGERVIIVNDRPGSGGSNGEFFRVGNLGVRCEHDYVDFKGNGNDYVYLDGKWSVNPEAYRVLEPVEAAKRPLSEMPAEEQCAEAIAILTRKTAELEAQVKELTDWHRRAAIDLRVAREDIVLIEEGVSGDIQSLEKRVTALESADAEVASGTVSAAAPSFLSAQQRRDAIVERAKADVDTLFARGSFPVTTVDGLQRNMNQHTHYVEYVVNREKRTVVALIRHKDGGRLRVKGIAKCAPGDVFNSHIGRSIALHRALGLEVPAEYLSVPNPTEVRVGDVIKDGFFKSRNMTGTVMAFEGPEGLTYDYPNPDRPDGYRWTFVENAQILDDSREDSGVTAASSQRKEAA